MEKARKQVLLARLFVIAALAAAVWMVRCHSGVVDSDEAGVVLALPDCAGAWTGDELFHCSSRSCGRAWLASHLPPGTAAGSPCPACGTPLDTMNYAERSMLPADTGLVRKQYVRAVPPPLPLTASIVLSGNDRTSIHRPQVCMVAAGYDIENEKVVAIDMGPGKPPLEVTVLDMVHPPSDDTPAPVHIFYAYWFVGKGRVTPSHVQRMIWMATDRIFHGVSHRWAYIAVSGLRDPSSNFHLQEIADFASALHPQILRPDFDSLDPTTAH
jgi:hypothetical protein